jgi:putative salt-induced outer membrane protein
MASGLVWGIRPDWARKPWKGYMMTRHIVRTGTMAAVFSMAAAAGMAQNTLTGVSALNDRIDDIDRAVQIDLNRSNDAYRNGAPEYRNGMSGSASLGFAGKTGATNSNDLSVGARLRFAYGPMVQNLGLVIDRAETGGKVGKEDAFAIYDANYYFDDSLYGFVLGRIKYDGLASTAGQIQTDAFIGVGPGYRVVNTPDVSWRVQVGLGMSFLRNGAGVDTSESGVIASSRLYVRLSDSLFATNDTDILNTNSALRVNNDLGLNVKMTDQFATRISYLTEFNNSRAVQTENKLGVSLVYSF